MSLYYDAAKFLLPSKDQSGSLKSRVFGTKDLRSSPKQVYAVVAEASRWSPILAEVVEKSQLLQYERKASSIPWDMKGFRSIDELGTHLGTIDVGRTKDDVSITTPSLQKAKQLQHPRWVRINTLKSTLENQLQTTFAGFENVTSLEQILVAQAATKVLHVDEHVPDLVALAPGTDLSKTTAYRNGSIILQDKASCFPAYLLDANPDDGTCLDACAAPGNKTTHLAAILEGQTQTGRNIQVWACERDKARAGILTGMVELAGCQDIVTVKAGQDFLLLNPAHNPWNKVGSLLLDPSCSGSGIVGRDETLAVTLPSNVGSDHVPDKSRKRKRHGKTDTNSIADVGEEKQGSAQPADDRLQERLMALSAFQLRLLLHAFRFPNARRISYSTCSIHATENEHVVLAALQSGEAKQYGWRLLTRNEQIRGMRTWPLRGDIQACQDKIVDGSIGAYQVAEDCIRCRPGTQEGTQGFFVAAFIRSAQEVIVDVESSNGDVVDSEANEDWNGLSDGEWPPPYATNAKI
ncbi:MAG: hypothetical protein Q9172_005131 [Xanthocarpia lactea]